jgi:adenylate kinase family enzyme
VDQAQAEPLVAFYRQKRLLYRLNGSGSSEQVFRRAMQLFRQYGWLKNFPL